MDTTQQQQQQQQQKQNTNVSEKRESETTVDNSKNAFKRETCWPSVLFYIHLHILGLYGLILMFTSASWLTIVFTFILTVLGILGATAGAHRLWAHNTYTASTTLKIFLMLCQTLAGQGSIYNWVRAHRLHHEKFRKDEDPFYSNRDLMSAQVYGQCLKYNAEQNALLEKVDMSDLEKDAVVMFQKRFYWILYLFIHVLVPINSPLEYWGDSLSVSILVAFSLRYMIVSNLCWLINSAHFVWALDKNFKPSDSNSVFFITKSYWPQYHYMLPNDYQSGEYGNYAIGCITSMIRVFAALDMATDLRTISSTAVRNGLSEAVETGRPIVDCINEYARKEEIEMPKNHFLNREKFM